MSASAKHREQDMATLLLLMLCCGGLIVRGAGLDKEEGEPCQYSRLDPNGVCAPASKCSTAIESLKKTRTHNLVRCGFSGEEEIVCCQPSKVIGETKPRVPDIRKCMTACSNYSAAMVLQVSPQILGGQNAYDGEFPHMAAIGFESDSPHNDIDWDCGGSLISDQYVLTAAHCITRQDQKLPVVVRMGVVDIMGKTGNTSPQDFEVEENQPHPKYDIRSKENDIALLRLKKTVTFSKYVLPACLYTSADDPKKLTIIGWGRTTHNGEASRILQKTATIPVDNESCNESYNTGVFPRFIPRSQLCAKSNDTVTRDTCQGDSGGPVQVNNLKETKISSIVGVTSFGRGCGGSLPSIYTRVYNYLDWIEPIVWS